MIVLIVLIVAGFTALIFGANWLVDGSSALAKKYSVSDLIIGLTIVSFGTSAPELVVNSVASINGYSDIILGNIIGSNNFNLFITLGIAGLIYPMWVQKSTVWKEIPISLIAAVALLLLANNFFIGATSGISRIDGIILLLFFAGFIFYVFKQMKSGVEPIEEITYEHKSNLKIWGLIIIGLAGLIIGGQLVVDNGVQLATQLGVSEKIIGLTIIAIGTSLPELLTSVVAALKKNTGIAIGNIIGSNIFNIFLILSVSSLIAPISYNLSFNTDIYILIGGTLFLFLMMFIGKRHKLDRWGAALLLIFYLAYTFYLVWLEL
ncbi:MAG TPA: calcium/sodium antiporter [Dysgonamonadaceae bacterium]|nr:calcium/sodium antiporter [Dysgonamonadaceae bacterium]